MNPTDYYNVTIKEEKDCQLITEFFIKDEIVSKEMENRISVWQKRVEIPGFRVGKAPLELVKSRYNEKILNEIKNELIQKSVEDFINKRALNIAMEPIVSDIKISPDGLYWKTYFEYHPIVNLKNYIGLKVIKRIKRIKDEDVKQALQVLREMNFRLVPLNEPVRENSFVAVDILAYENEKMVDKLTQKNVLLDMSSKDLANEIKAALKGAKKGDKRILNMKMPDNYIHKELSSKNITLEMTINEVKEKVLPEINNEFAIDLGYENLDGLKSDLKERLTKRSEVESENDLRERIFEALLNENKFPVPPSIVENQARVLFNGFIERMRRENIPVEFLKQNMKELTKKIYEQAKKQVQIFYIINEIIKREKIEITTDEIESAKEDFLKTQGIKKDIFEKYLEENLSSIISNLRIKKTLDFLIKNAKIKEEII